MLRWIWLLLGLLSLALGIIGIVVPLLPTVPLVILAAFFFARSSERLHDWLVEHRHLGPPIKDWRERGAISGYGKRIATVSIAAVFGISVILGLKPIILGIQGLILSATLIFIWSRPSA